MISILRHQLTMHSHAVAAERLMRYYQRLQRSVAYRWETTGATSSLLNYAKVIGEKGDLKTADKICKLIISKCDDNVTIQNKTAALDIYVGLAWY